MSSAEIIDFTSRMMFLVLILSLPSIIAAAVVSTAISFVQAMTQVQEQTLGFAGKLIVVIIVLYLTSNWLGSEMFAYTNMIFDKLPHVTETL